MNSVNFDLDSTFSCRLDCCSPIHSRYSSCSRCGNCKGINQPAGAAGRAPWRASSASASAPSTSSPSFSLIQSGCFSGKRNERHEYKLCMFSMHLNGTKNKENCDSQDDAGPHCVCRRSINVCCTYSLNVCLLRSAGTVFLLLDTFWKPIEFGDMSCIWSYCSIKVFPLSPFLPWSEAKGPGWLENRGKINTEIDQSAGWNGKRSVCLRQLLSPSPPPAP